MAVTFNAGFNLYEGTLAERPVAGSTYFNALYRASNTRTVYKCETQPPRDGFSYAGASYYWNEALVRDNFYAQKTIQDGDIIGNTATETAFQSQIGVLADTIRIGTVLRVQAVMRYGTAAVLPGTLTLRLKHNSIDTPQSLLASSAYALPAGDSGNDIVLNAVMVCASDGSIVGALEKGGSLIDSGLGAALVCSSVSGGVFDTFADQLFLLTVQFSVADVANTITLRQFVLEILNSTPGV